MEAFKNVSVYQHLGNDTSFNISANVTHLAEEDPIKRTLKDVTSVLTVSILSVIMVALGCTIEVNALITQIKRPLAPILGMVLQFIVFPLLVFALVHAFQLNDYDALGMLLIGTSPGGSFSNLVTFWCGGDVVLSVCMTSLATTIAVGMMPLNLYIYTRSFSDSSIKIPYTNIIIALFLILIPVSIGMVIRRKLPKVAHIITLMMEHITCKVGGALGFIFILLVTSINLYMFPQMFDASWTLWFVACLLPAVGLLVGYIGAMIAKLSNKQCRTVAIEISSQNAGLCFTITFISFEVQIASKIVIFPIIFAVFSVVVFLIFTAFVRIGIFIMRKKKRELEAVKFSALDSDAVDLKPFHC